MSITVDTALDYPAALLKRRVQRPGYLYAVVDKAHITNEPRTSLISNLDVFTKTNIEAHLALKSDDAVVNGLITAYEDEEVALNHAKRGKTAKLTLSTDGLVAAWQITTKGIQVPIWFVSGEYKGPGVKEQRNLWICLEEARVVLDIDEKLGEKGTWLACGPFTKRIVTGSLKPQGRRTTEARAEPAERVFDNEEKEEADRQARRERRQLARDAEHPTETEKLGRKDSCSLQPPKIPTRKSSLKSLVLKTKTRSSDAHAPKLRVTTRDATISLTNADQHRAASLMKYALLMAHGKRLEAEEAWLVETTPSGRGVDRGESMRKIRDASRPEDDTDSQRDQGSDADAESLLTPQETTRASSRQPFVFDHGHESSVGRPSRREGFEQPQWQHDVPSDNDSYSGQEQRIRNRRSAAPSPSQSLLGYRSPEVDLETEPEPEPALHVRRSRRDLLIELQSDEDALLREYARVSLLDGAAFKDQRDKRNEGVSHETDHQAYHRDVDQVDSPSTPRRNPGYQSTRSASGSLAPLFHPPPSIEPEDSTEKEPKPPVPGSLYSLLSLSSLSSFASHTSVENAAHPTPSFVGQHAAHDLENHSLKPASAIVDDEDQKAQPRSEPATLRSRKITGREGYKAASPKSYVGQEQQQSQQQSKDNASRSESLFAKSKGLREKGKEISGRLAELRERQKPAVVKKRDSKWDVGDIWGQLGSNSER